MRLTGMRDSPGTTCWTSADLIRRCRSSHTGLSGTRVRIQNVSSAGIMATQNITRHPRSGVPAKIGYTNWNVIEAKRYPQYHPPSIKPETRPRKRVGQCSNTSGIPAAHSPPIPMPKSARSPNSIAYDVEKPLRKANSENQRTESISGTFRPHLSASAPARVPPTRRIINVTVPSRPARARSTEKLFSISMRMKVRMLKSNASTIQPRNTAQNARHWSPETWRYQGNSEFTTASRTSFWMAEFTVCGLYWKTPLYGRTPLLRQGGEFSRSKASRNDHTSARSYTPFRLWYSAPPMAENVWQIYALRYAHHERAARENFMTGDPHDESPMPLDYYVWALKSGNGTIVVDTGFDETMAR